jgi:hypothetical protein
MHAAIAFRGTVAPRDVIIEVPSNSHHQVQRLGLGRQVLERDGATPGPDMLV